MYADGLRSDGKGSGYVIRKIINKIMDNVELSTIESIDFEELSKKVCKSLQILGYDAIKSISEFSNLIKKDIRLYTRKVIKEKGNLRRTIIKNDGLNIDKNKWLNERGLSYNQINDVLDSLGLNKLIPSEKKGKTWLRNECYSFDTKLSIINPIQFLQEIENKRLQ